MAAKKTARKKTPARKHQPRSGGATRSFTGLDDLPIASLNTPNPPMCDAPRKPTPVEEIASLRSRIVDLEEQRDRAERMAEDNRKALEALALVYGRGGVRHGGRYY